VTYDHEVFSTLWFKDSGFSTPNFVAKFEWGSTQKCATQPRVAESDN